MSIKQKIELYKKRPVSPHLTIYKPQTSSTFSIFHRFTGTALYFSFLVIAWWLVALISTNFEESILNLSSCLIMRIAFVGLFFSLNYHCLNGIRHLFWDLGYLFEIKQIDYSAYVVISVAIILTGVISTAFFTIMKEYVWNIAL